jgi:uncharacterized membrane protein
VKRIFWGLLAVVVIAFVFALVAPRQYNEVLNWVVGFFQGVGEEAND